jgi:hypothetical protein
MILVVVTQYFSSVSRPWPTVGLAANDTPGGFAEYQFFLHVAGSDGVGPIVIDAEFDLSEGFSTSRSGDGNEITVLAPLLAEPPCEPLCTS